MRSTLFSICFLVLFSLLETTDSTAQESSPFVAVITSINGNVLLKKAGKTEFVKTFWGTQLYQGDQLKTTDNADVSLIYSNNSVVKLGPNNLITINKTEPSATEKAGNVKKVSSAMMVNMSALTSKRQSKNDVGALAGLRGTGIEESIELTSPANTLIRTDRPTFMWIPRKPYDKFIVNLYNSKGLVWSNKVSENTLKFPETEKGLEPGETYFWNVEGEDLLDNKKSSSYKFSVLSFEKSKEVKDQEALIRKTFDNDSDSSSLHSFLGAFYINQGLLQDAINEFEIISGMNPDAPLPHEILGSLYSDAGNKDKAIEELQKALSLAKGKEK
jgi:tetratricopeptide (TPR) repeat protein